MLDTPLKLKNHLKMVSVKISKSIGFLLPFLPRAAHMTIHKACLRPHLDYNDPL